MKVGLMTLAGAVATAASFAAAATIWLVVREPARVAEVIASGEPLAAVRALAGVLVALCRVLLRFL